ncbi:hypothetical protein [Parasedimentitalea psychrophila]|uniref:Uncharacterized protein n=1 Tax=Parasedimentitalea psychrophila TaxID=2997337 RepID=A0A9Y2L4A4_9RHOB|nr:hypothetical protein [Parasedimentitalea psychrophila]WIY27700.1 hypothetical protein QPJ95_02055 [Parasedimentitalea psychrophila]
MAAILPFERIRTADGDKMEIMCELHSLWNVPTAKRICHGLQDEELVGLQCSNEAARVANNLA